MESIQDVVKKYQQGGNNCSETVLKACNEYYGLNLSDDVFRMVSVMGGGVGGSGCLCGALNGACHILGLLVGRNTPEEKTKADMNAPVREFYQLWMDRFHASCCRVLKSPANGGPVSCPELMVGTAELLAAFIEEKGLLKK